MKLKPFVLCLAALGMSSTMLQSIPAIAASDYPTDGRIKILRYDPNDIYTIYTLYGYQTNIEFSNKEDIETISVGDRSLWQIIPSGNRIFIRPMDDDVTTNMTVITTKRTYQFDLKSGSGSLEQNRRMVYVARFSYPEEDQARTPAFQASPIAAVSSPSAPATPYKPLMTPPPAEPIKTVTPSVPQPSVAAPVPLAPPPVKSDMMQPLNLTKNYLYTYTGEDSLAPVQVYDDGRSTFLRFNTANTVYPDVFLMDEKGRLSSIKTTMRDGFVVVNTVAPRMVLSYPDTKQSVYLYNEALNPEDISHGS